MSNYIEYIYESHFIHSFFPGTGTDVCFTIRTQTQYFGLSPASANTERACKEYCISLPYCTIMDFVFRGSGTLCWVQDAPMTIDETNFNPNNDINDYRLNRTCVDILKSSESFER